MLKAESNSNPNIDTVCMDAVEFSQSTKYSPYDRIMLKGMAHLLTHEERLLTMEGFRKHLAPNNGKLLIIFNVRAPELFPFDERTQHLFEKDDLDLELLYAELKHAGFKNIQQQTFTYEFPPNSIKADDWIYILENRLWTQFSEKNINKQQMADLLNHVRKQFENPVNFQTRSRQTIIKCCAE